MARAWREHRRTAIAVALLNPLFYILVLTAMVFTPVSYVAPARARVTHCTQRLGHKAGMGFFIEKSEFVAVASLADVDGKINEGDDGDSPAFHARKVSRFRRIAALSGESRTARSSRINAVSVFPFNASRMAYSLSTTG